jgi:hypothetical protein
MSTTPRKCIPLKGSASHSKVAEAKFGHAWLQPTAAGCAAGRLLCSWQPRRGCSGRTQAAAGWRARKRRAVWGAGSCECSLTKAVAPLELLGLGYGCSRGLLVGIVRRRLAAAEREVVKAGGKAIEVGLIRITKAGRRTRRSHANVLPNCSTKTSPESIRRLSRMSSIRKC